ncbi:TetR family transcriptional regulator [Paenibacillus taihuensis]|uniref:TetR family transcriptional regulator n=1 Tax=Paenibacillus taihuensis TaxID=1156355 RepID=A0A3D9R4C2_9BACL|nr:TetR/AcrR family transcriptional regulator [Paenibacillus taihuensis]REE68687.1 TetR family transcriptional regulator [Paenibacillus taihuensis]
MKEANKEPKESKQSFIAEARREQIVEAAIKTLDEIGYVSASLSQIAKRAGISTALISYHFADKYDLMNDLITRLLEQSSSYILERVSRADTAREKLRLFIEASLAYQGTHPARNAALLEIIFNGRTPENIPYYKLGDDDEELVLIELKRILSEGQQSGEFGAFHIDVMASVIQGAIGEYMSYTGITKRVDLETYAAELVSIVSRAVGINI